MKASIEQLKKSISDAKSRQDEATKDIKRIEKDMNDFSNNKDSKLAELQDALSSLKKTQTKNSIAVKTLQKELQSARLEAEQAGADLGAAQDQLTEIGSTLKVQDAEVDELKKEQSQAKVGSRSVLVVMRSAKDRYRMPTTWHKHVSMTSEQNLQASTRN